MSDLSNPIALVEDDPGFNRALGRLLRATGFVTRTFSSAEEYLAETSPDSRACLILDIELPGISGLELLDQLVSRGSATAAIFITAQDGEEVDRQVSARPGCTLLHKPFLGTDLIGAIRRHLASDRAADDA